MEIPQGQKSSVKLVSVKIDDKDRARIYKQMVSINDKLSAKEDEMTKLKEKHKTEIASLADDITGLQEDIDVKFTIGKTGLEQREIDCFERKNFEKDPPVREYIDAKTKVVISEEKLEVHEFQVKTTEWVVGEPKKPAMKASKGKKTEEKEGENDELPVDLNKE